MTKINLEEFDTSTILKAVDQFDRLRALLSDSENCRPPQLREDLLKLHDLAMQVANGTNGETTELVDQAFEIEDQLDDLSQAVDFIQSVLRKIAANSNASEHA